MNDYKELITELRNCEKFAASSEIPVTFSMSTENLIRIADTIEQLVKERDAAISQICQGCDNCKYRDSKIGEPCISCSTYRIGGDFIKSNWEWRGVQE